MHSLQPNAVDVAATLGAPFATLASDARIRTKADQFVDFVKQHNITDPVEAKHRFKAHLGQVRVYRGLCLVEGSRQYRRIFEDGILYSKLAAATDSLATSLESERRIGYERGILARLHQPGTEYAESEFVFSVAKFPEPQILPATAALNGSNKVYLLHFEMPAFDLLGITMADVARTKSRRPYLFRYCGILFNGSDPDVEIFVLHKTHIRNLTCQVFEMEEAVLEFCRPYQQSMEKEYGGRG